MKWKLLITQCVINKIEESMSRSIHTTYKNLKGLTKNEINEQFNDPNSDLATLSQKKGIKKQVKKSRKQYKVNKNGL